MLRNLDENGIKLGVVPWRSVIRVFDEKGEVRYAEVFLTADSLQAANELAVSAAESLLVGEDPTGMEDGKPVPGPGASDSPSTDPPEVLGKIGGKTVDKTGESSSESVEDVQEVLAHQSRFAQSQMQAYALQAQELGRLVAEAMQQGMQTRR